MKRLFLRFLIAFVVLGVITAVAVGYVHNRANVAEFEPVVVEDFEGEDLEAFNPRIRWELCCDDSAEIVDLATTGREGQGVQIQLRPTDEDVKGSKRSEFRLPAGHFGKPVWYRVRMRIDPDWAHATNPVTLVQWHGVPDKALLEGNRAPPLRLLNWKGQNYVVLNWDTSPRTFKSFTLFGERQGTMLWIGADAPGKWEDWVFRVEWERRTDGRVSVWRNGEMLVDHRGFSAYNDLEAPYMKVGIYVPRWKSSDDEPETSLRRAVFDDVWEVYPEEAGVSLPENVKSVIERLSADLEK